MQSDLEKIGIDARNALKVKNIYNDGDGKVYDVNHSRALSDDSTPLNGKGTGLFLDTDNGGSDADINGTTLNVGSGRIKNVATNEYNKDKEYVKPDTEGNIGQVIL